MNSPRPSIRPLQRPLLAVDWGTTSLRAAWCPDDRVLDTRHSDQGILKVTPGEFPQVLRSLCGDWLDHPRVLCLISGMAGSAQGWQLAPYCPCPAGGSDLSGHLHWIEPGRIALVPGLSCELAHAPDVMRGEEVQIFGAMQLHGLRDARVVLPGTHSKWVQVQDGRIQYFSTHMTGEIYALLRQHSILSRTLRAMHSAEPVDAQAFDRGVKLSLGPGGLLHHVFSTRTLSLMERATPEALASYLSGLIIGEELRTQSLAAGSTVWVIGSEALQSRYQRALALLDVQTHCLGDTATWSGLMALAQTLRHS